MTTGRSAQAPEPGPDDHSADQNTAHTTDQNPASPADQNTADQNTAERTADRAPTGAPVPAPNSNTAPDPDPDTTDTDRDRDTDGGGSAPRSAAHPGATAGEEWHGVEHGLLPMRRLVLLSALLPLTAATALVPGLTAGPVWALFALLPLAFALWGWGALARNWRSWRYAERADDLLIARGVLWREMTVVPYGRMQLVEVTSGPLERRYGLARLQLHTAAATTDATIPGLTPDEAERLRDRLTELGEARSAGL